MNALLEQSQPAASSQPTSAPSSEEQTTVTQPYDPISFLKHGHQDFLRRAAWRGVACCKLSPGISPRISPASPHSGSLWLLQLVWQVAGVRSCDPSGSMTLGMSEGMTLRVTFWVTFRVRVTPSGCPWA